MAGSEDAKRAGNRSRNTAGQAVGGDRDSEWPLFVQGGPGDRARPNAWQVGVLNDLSGADGRCAGATDDEGFGVLGQGGVAGAGAGGGGGWGGAGALRRRPG